MAPLHWSRLISSPVTCIQYPAMPAALRIYPSTVPGTSAWRSSGGRYYGPLRDAAGTDDHYWTVIQDTSHDTLVYIHRFNFWEVHFKCAPDDEPFLDHNAPVSDDEFCQPSLEPGIKGKGEYRSLWKENYPVVFGFIYYYLILDEVPVYIASHCLYFY